MAALRAAIVKIIIMNIRVSPLSPHHQTVRYHMNAVRRSQLITSDHN